MSAAVSAADLGGRELCLALSLADAAKADVGTRGEKSLRLLTRSLGRIEAYFTRDPWALRELPLIWRLRRRVCNALDHRELDR